MRYGFCTDFASKKKDSVDYDLLCRIKQAGFDFAEIPLQLIVSLTEEEFEELIARSKEIGLANDVCCNFFPASVRLTGPEVDYEVIGNYLKIAFERASLLGVKKIIFGSCPARNLPEGFPEEEGYKQIVSLLNEYIIPLCKKYDIMVAIEPIRSGPCNFIITLPDGMKVVNQVNSPYVTLLADAMHMAYENEDPDHINEYFGSINHVHIANIDRILPEDAYCSIVEQVIKNLAKNGYDKTISFESKDGKGLESMIKALKLLKAQFS